MDYLAMVVPFHSYLDQAIIADSVTTGGSVRDVGSHALLPASSEIPMPILSEIGLPDLVGVGGGTKIK
jgi:hypothetical protein